MLLWIFNVNRTKGLMILWLLPHHHGLLSEPCRVPLVLTVHIHFLWSKRHAAVAVEVQAVVAADVRLLLLLFSILWLQELREAGLWALGPEETETLHINTRFKEMDARSVIGLGGMTVCTVEMLQTLNIWKVVSVEFNWYGVKGAHIHQFTIDLKHSPSIDIYNALLFWVLFLTQVLYNIKQLF